MWSVSRHDFPRRFATWSQVLQSLWAGQRQSLRSRASETICALRMVVKHCSETVLSVNYHRRLAMHLPEESLFDDAKDENTTSEDNQSLDKYPTCCMHKVLSLQADFWAEIPWLQQIIQDAGHKCYFLPKFHYELNSIEMYWGWVKICKLHALPTLVMTFW